MNSLARRMTFSVLAVTCALPLAAAEGDPTGFWSGGIEVPGRQLPVMVDIERADGAWTAALFIVDQGVRNEPMKDVDIAPPKVSFKIPGMPGDPIFVGQLVDDGATIAGEYTQGGRTFPFRLSRGELPEELKVDVYARFRETRAKGGEGLAGGWRSVFRVGPHRYRMVLEVESAEDGAYRSTLQNLDRGPKEPQPVEGTALESGTLRLTLGGGAEFEGRLSDDGQQINGHFRQAGQEFPLDFWRAR